MAITIIPIPPSHCIRALHNKILFGALSKFEITVDPVVVIPDILSKKESLKDNSKLENKNGKQPNNATDVQAIEEKRNVCCRFKIESLSKFISIKRIPIKIVTKEEDKKL